MEKANAEQGGDRQRASSPTTSTPSPTRRCWQSWPPPWKPAPRPGSPRWPGTPSRSPPPAKSLKATVVRDYTVMEKDRGPLPADPTARRVRITVRDKPRRPRPRRSATERPQPGPPCSSGPPPSDNGAAITKYTVRSGNGIQPGLRHPPHVHPQRTDQRRQVPSSPVTATNEVKESDPSPASNEIRPDEKPSPPEAPTVKAGDKNMVIAWPAAKTEGSAVKNYNLEISPPPASGVAVKNGVTGLNYTWPALTNGVRYKVRAQAANQAVPDAAKPPAGATRWRPGRPGHAGRGSPSTSNQPRWTGMSQDDGDAIKTHHVYDERPAAAVTTQQRRPGP